MANGRLCALTTGAVLSCGWLLLACGSASSGGSDAGQDSGKDSGGGTDTGGGHESGKPESGTKETGPTDTGGGEAAPNTTPITGLKASTWTWVPFPGALCRDGSSTGIGVSLGSSDKVMLFLEGGGACFNPISCADQNPASFSETDFEKLTTLGSTWEPYGYSANVGIMDRTNAKNPVQDWTYVYVPYCTGDVHAGNNIASVAGIGSQHFVGYTNIGLYLDRLVPTFSKASQVLLAGMSAGGFGAAANYERVAQAFGKIPVTLLDDSGPFFGNPTLATCQQTQLRTLWGLDGTVGKECGGDCTSASSFFLDYAAHVVSLYPKVNFGLAESTDDGTISVFFGFGFDDCKSYQQVSAGVFESGLLDIRTRLSKDKNFGEFLFVGTDHTSIQGPEFYTRTSGDVVDAGAIDGGFDAAGIDRGTPTLMTDWVAALINGKAADLGP
jgi:Pectinacetylesterase